jgi:hypothetical protein
MRIVIALSLAVLAAACSTAPEGQKTAEADKDKVCRTGSNICRASGSPSDVTIVSPEAIQALGNSTARPGAGVGR